LSRFVGGKSASYCVAQASREVPIKGRQLNFKSCVRYTFIMYVYFKKRHKKTEY